MAACRAPGLLCLFKLLCLFQLRLILCDPQCQRRVIYGAVNGSVTFPVAASVFFKEILWKKGQYPVIQWEVRSQPEPRTFWPFVGRTSLNTASGDLRIFNLTHSDEDEYELESSDIKDDIKFHLEVIDPALQVDMVVPNATVPEKATFQLDCSIIMSRSSWASQFAVTWYFLRTKVGGRKDRPDLEELEAEGPLEEENDEVAPRKRTTLLRVGLEGIFGPEGSAWEGRLRFQKLLPLLHRLTVLQARPQDTGNYSCRVEEWLPGPQGAWYQLTEQESAPIRVRVLDTGSTQQPVICLNKTLFCCSILLFLTILIITILCVLGKCRNSSENSNRTRVSLLGIRQPHLILSPSSLEAPVAQQPPRAIDQGPWWTSASETVRCCPCSVTGQWEVPDTSAGGD